MSADVDAVEEVPAWVVVGNHAWTYSSDKPHTAEVEANGPEVSLDGEGTANAKLTIRTAQTTLRVTGDIGGGSRLYVYGENLQKVDVQAQFKSIEVLSSGPSCTLGIPIAAATLTVCGAKWTLNRPKPDGDESQTPLECLTVVDEQSSSVELNGNAAFQHLDSKVKSTKVVDLPDVQYAQYVATGLLALHRAPSMRARVTANELVVHGAGPPATYIVTESAKFPKGLGEPPASSGSEDLFTVREMSRVEQATSVEVGAGGAGDVRDAHLTTTGQVTVHGSLSFSTVDAHGSVAIQNDVVASHVSITTSEGMAVKVGRSGHSSIPDVPPDDTADWNAAFAETIQTKTGAVTDSTIDVHGAGHVSVRTITGSRVETDGHLRTTGSLETGNGVSASYVLAKKLSQAPTDAGRLRTRRLACETIDGVGPISADEHIICKAVNENPKAKEGASGLSLTAPVVVILSSTRNCPHVEVTTRLDATLNETSTLSCTVQGHVSLAGGTIEKLALSGTSRIELQTTLKHLQTAQHPCTVLMDDAANIERGEVQKLLRLVAPPESDLRINLQQADHVRAVLGRPTKRQPKEPNSRAQLELGDGAELVLWQRLKAGADKLAPCKVRVNHAAPWAVAVEARYQAKTCNLVAATSGRLGAAPSLELQGDVRAHLNGVFRQLDADARRGDGPVPTLHLETKATAVHNACGNVNLGNEVHGTIYGRSRRQPSQSLAVRSVANLANAQSSSGSKSEAKGTGKLLDVDITRLAPHELEQLRHLDVLDPTPVSLRRFGDIDTTEKEPDAQRAELRIHAEKATVLLDVLHGTAVSGGSQAAAKWAAARLHHRAIPEKTTERRLRWFHWSVGYSQNPVHPALTWLAIYVTVVTTRVGCWTAASLGPFCQGTETFTGGLVARAAGEALLLPFTLVRFTQNPDPLFYRGVVNLIAFAFLAVPFLFLIIALKNYLSLKDS